MEFKYLLFCSSIDLFDVKIYRFQKNLTDGNLIRKYVSRKFGVGNGMREPRIQERGRECGECRERVECSLEFRGISERIPGNDLILAFRGMLEKIPENVQEYSGECSGRFRECFQS